MINNFAWKEVKAAIESKTNKNISLETIEDVLIAAKNLMKKRKGKQ